MNDTDYWIVAYRKFAPRLYDLAQQHHAQLGVYANATMMGQGTSPASCSTTSRGPAA